MSIQTLRNKLNILLDLVEVMNKNLDIQPDDINAELYVDFSELTENILLGYNDSIKFFSKRILFGLMLMMIQNNFKYSYILENGFKNEYLVNDLNKIELQHNDKIHQLLFKVNELMYFTTMFIKYGCDFYGKYENKFVSAVDALMYIIVVSGISVDELIDNCIKDYSNQIKTFERNIETREIFEEQSMVNLTTT